MLLRAGAKRGVSRGGARACEASPRGRRVRGVQPPLRRALPPAAAAAAVWCLQVRTPPCVESYITSCPPSDRPRPSRWVGLRFEFLVHQDNEHAHVVARAQMQAMIDELLADGPQIPRPLLRRRRGRLALLLLGLSAGRGRARAPLRRPPVDKKAAHLFDNLLRGHHVPDAVAREHDKLVLVRVARLDHDLRKRGDGLRLSLDRLTPLVHKVAKRARDGEVAVDAVELDGAAGRLDPRLLLRVVRLVVVRQRHRLPRAAEHGARVARVRADDVLWRDERHDRCGSGLVLARLYLWLLQELRVDRHQRGLERLGRRRGEVGVGASQRAGAREVLRELARNVVRDKVAAVPVVDAE
mmetsp:Transcript_19603/g.62890  ORF Transcript_19603/g.62890 Transcript_19603/m.62890 type:complete len:354 (-) Transcript_19603:980-2041(-)